ncbi:MAG TPA: protein kinase [Chloroflexi bacterium]|nr:protein kinase [Chloroflexota bacterium]HBY06847.1 protein kinase [Chloroflexota bacterium]
MGAVYRARDLRFTAVRIVALKEMINQARDILVRDTIVKNFEREANILASLNHTSIPKIHDYFTVDNRSYVIMEFIQGNNLEVILTQTQGYIPEAQIITWAIEVCDVLQYLHTHEPEPIVFRDMKPANIMVTPGNHVVLVDFGIARTFESGQKGTMIGTEGYSPPEQYRGEAPPQVDIYALGATMHHLLTRKDPRIEPPFTFSERQITKINPSISVELEAVVNTALQYGVADRFPTAADMKTALLSVARKTGILTDANMATSVITPNQSIQPLWTFQCEDEIRGTARYASGFVYVGAYDNNLYALNATTGEFAWKYAAEGGIVSKPAVYESSLIFGSEDGRLYEVSSRTGSVQWTCYTDGPIRSSPTLSDRHIFIGSDDEHLHIINANTGNRVLNFNAGAPVRSTPLVVNDVVYFGTENGDFFCLDFQGKMKWQMRAKRAVTSSPVMVDDVVYFGSMDTTFYAVEARTGWVIWRFRLGRGTISTPKIVDQLAFIGCIDGNLYCINTRSSKEVWRFETENQVTGSPLIYRDSVYFGSVDGNVYCLEYRTGRLRWKYMTEKPITATPIIHDDILYIGSTDHKLYALPV